MSHPIDHLFELVKAEVQMLKGVGYKLTRELIDTTLEKFATKHPYLLKNVDVTQEKEKLYGFFHIQND